MRPCWSTGRSEHSESLLALAAAYATRYLTDAEAVAATGSVGRGDAEVGSDLDLWVISDRERVDHDVFEGVPVTIMCESEARVLDVSHQACVEVEYTRVVADPEGIFARVLATYAEHAASIRRWNIEDARGGIRTMLANSREGSPQGRVWSMRNAAHLACSLRVYEETGLMMPKMRHFKALLPGRVYDTLRAIQGIDEVAPHCHELLASTRYITDRMTAQLHRLSSTPLAVPLPHHGLRKLEHGDIADGVLLLRGCFETSFIDQVHAALPGISMVRFLLHACDQEIRRYWQLLHGLDGALDAKLETTRLALHDLLDQLGIAAADS